MHVGAISGHLPDNRDGYSKQEMVDILKDLVELEQFQLITCLTKNQRIAQRFKYLCDNFGEKFGKQELKELSEDLSRGLPLVGTMSKNDVDSKMSTENYVPTTLVRTKSLEESKIRQTWKVGDEIEVYSTSGDGWYKGKIDKIFKLESKEMGVVRMIKVHYERDGQHFQKEMNCEEPLIRPVMMSEEDKKDYDNQREQITSLASQAGPLKVGDRRAIIPVSWARKWAAYVKTTYPVKPTAASTSSSSVSSSPGEILLDSLYSMDSYNKLKRGIRESRDYVSVPESVSKAWLQWCVSFER
eukprot:jgi/Bigna1/126060/aug1.2_g768